METAKWRYPNVTLDFSLHTNFSAAAAWVRNSRNGGTGFVVFTHQIHPLRSVRALKSHTLPNSPFAGLETLRQLTQPVPLADIAVNLNPPPKGMDRLLTGRYNSLGAGSHAPRHVNLTLVGWGGAEVSQNKIGFQARLRFGPPPFS